LALKRGIIPSIDDISINELQNIIEEIRQEDELKMTTEEEKASDDVTSAVALFDKMQAKEDKELDDSCSSVRSTNSFRSLTTRRAKLTVLNKKAYA
jgi:hypothetical protein